MVFAIHRHESATGAHVSPHSEPSIPPPSAPRPSGLSQSTSFECPTSCIKLPLVIYFQFSSVAQSCPTLCNPMDPQHVRPPCPSPTPGLCPNSCPLSWWCHPTISFSVVPFSPLLQSFPALGSFPMSQFFTSGDQNIGVSASAKVLPMYTQNWSPLGWTDYGNIHVSMLFSHIIPPSPSSTQSKSLFFTTVSLLLSCLLGHHYRLSKFHIYVLIYCIGASLSDLFHLFHIGSSFIHFIRTDSNVFFFIAE